MASTYTQRDLVYRALADLGVTPAGQAPNDEDFSAVNASVPDVLARLEAEGIAYIPDPDAIPRAYLRPLALCVADANKSEFGNPAIDIMGAELTLRRLSASRATYEVLSVEYF